MKKHILSLVSLIKNRIGPDLYYRDLLDSLYNMVTSIGVDRAVWLIKEKF